MKKFQKYIDKRLEFYYNVRVMKKLTQKEVRSWMVQLAQSQGFYGRLLRNWDNALPLARREFMKSLHRHMVIEIWDFIAYCEE